MGSAKKTLTRLVEETHGKSERTRFAEFEPTNEHLEVALEIGRVLLEENPPQAGACAYLSSAWALKLQTEHGLPVHCVAGDLRIRRTWAFRTSGPNISHQLDESTDDWEGHCWIQFGCYKIGDLSVCRTAYHQPDSSNLKAAVFELFGPRRGLFIAPRGILLDNEFEYTPRYVLSNLQMSNLSEQAV